MISRTSLGLSPLLVYVDHVGWADIRTVLVGEWVSISGLRLNLVAGLVAAALAIWLVVNWRYGGIVSSLRARLKLAEERNGAFEREFPGKTPAQAAARLRRLEAYMALLPARRLTDEQKRAIAGAGSPPADATRVAIVHDSVSAEVGRYARDIVEAYSATPGWNVVDDFYPMTPQPLAVGVAVGLADLANPTQTETLVLLAMRDAGIGHDILPRTTHGADVEIIVSAR